MCKSITFLKIKHKACNEHFIEPWIIKTPPNKRQKYGQKSIYKKYQEDLSGWEKVKKMRKSPKQNMNEEVKVGKQRSWIYASIMETQKHWGRWKAITLHYTGWMCVKKWVRHWKEKTESCP